MTLVDVGFPVIWLSNILNVIVPGAMKVILETHCEHWIIYLCF